MKKYKAFQFKILRFRLVFVLSLNQKGDFGRTLALPTPAMPPTALSDAPTDREPRHFEEE